MLSDEKSEIGERFNSRDGSSVCKSGIAIDRLSHTTIPAMKTVRASAIFPSAFMSRVREYNSMPVKHVMCMLEINSQLTDSNYRSNKWTE